MTVIFNDNMFVYRSGGRTLARPDPHLGLMSLATTLSKAGYEAAITDPKILFNEGGFTELTDDFLHHWAHHCLAQNPEIIGFTAYGRTLPYAIRVAEILRQQGYRKPILAGGPHATIVGETLLEAFPVFDVVVQYEAETIITPLVEALLNGDALGHIPNLLYRQGDEIAHTGAEQDLIDINAIPAPALGLYPDKYLRNVELSVEAGRGCPFACTFCSTARFFKRRYRLKSNERILEEIAHCQKEYGTSFFNLNHDLFGLHKKSLREFCQMAKGRGFKWKCSMRSDTLDLDLLDELAEAGCVDIYFGIETGSERLQTLIKKNLDLVKTKASLAMVVSKGLHCTASFITGFPEETEADQNQTLNMIGELWALAPQQLRAQLHMLSPEPGTDLDEEDLPIRFDGIGPEADDLLEESLIENHPALFSVFYHYPSSCPRWRTIATSTFVNFIAPEIGVPLINHMIQQYFDGRLSQLIDRMTGDTPIRFTDSATVTDLVMERFLAMVEDMSRTPETAYLKELVQFSRIGTEMRAFAQQTPETARNYVWLLNCKYDTLGLVSHILSNNLVSFRECLASGLNAAPGGKWFLMSYGTDFSLQSKEMDASAIEAFYGHQVPGGTSSDPICLQIA
ncbi:MAG: B12-binding domain-containing radical SAM protein [Alphaproteobacteria bacterium]|nr:B12-binding domain-containing radical SAM protein [Alphaproteobacteria bacterium]